MTRWKCNRRTPIDGALPSRITSPASTNSCQSYLPADTVSSSRGEGTTHRDVAYPNQSLDFNVTATTLRTRRPTVKQSPRDSIDHTFAPVTAEERQCWKGWCEIESDPAFFNVILHELGVNGVKVEEPWTLDEEAFRSLAAPVYGLIFCFPYKEDDPTRQEATCPDHVWFANQTTSNSCATVAMLNIIMNVPEVDTGAVVGQLREVSTSMTPALRGYMVGNHDYIRQVHNSFIRRMDMLNADLFLSNEAAPKKAVRRGKASSTAKEQESDNGFHFVAFVPIDGCVWKLDGLERQPMNLGEFEEDWIDLARPLIRDRMLAVEERYSLLALCRSPLRSIPHELAVNIVSLNALEDHLNLLQPDWADFVDDNKLTGVLRGPDGVYKVTQEHLGAAVVPKSMLDKLAATTPTAELIDLQSRLIHDQTKLRQRYLDEVATIEQGNERALSRRHDFTPLVHSWVKFLAEKGVLQTLVETCPK